jgi:uncharacterized delta-60 repeat protein
MIAIFIRRLRNRPRHSLHTRRRATIARRLLWDHLEDRRLLNAASLDPTFGRGGVATTSFPLADALSQATSEIVDLSGRILAAGYYNDAQDHQRVVLARYNPDGSLDTSFGDDGRVYTPIDAITINQPVPETVSLAIDPQGRIVVAGAGSQPFLPHAGSTIFDFMVARFTGDGRLDTGFGDDGVAALAVGPTDQTSDMPSAIAVRPDGKILVAGTSTLTGTNPNFPGSDFAVAQLDTDGRLDARFGAKGWAIAAFPDAAAGASVAQATAMALQPDGRIVVAGGAGDQPFFEDTEFAAARFNADGTLDPSFGTGGEVTSDLGDPSGADAEVANAVLLQPDGRIVLGGQQVKGFSQSNFALLRLNPDGSPDPSFGSDGVVSTVVPNNSFIDSLSGLALQGNDKIVAVGSNFNPSNFNEGGLVLARYNRADGSLDTSFGQGGLVDSANPTGGEVAFAVAVQGRSRRIIVAGYTYDPNDVFNTGSFELARYDTDGSLDPSFGTEGKAITDFRGSRDQLTSAVAVLPDGGLVVAGTTGTTINASTPLTPDIGVAEYNPDGSLNHAFGRDGRVITPSGGVFEVQITAVAVQPNGKVVVAGWIAPTVFDDEFLLLRYNADGSLDTSFGQGGEVEIGFGDGSVVGGGVAIQPDGKIVEVGSGGFDNNFDVVRVNPNGSLDTSFGTGGEVSTPMGGGASSVLIQPDGKIVVGGTSFSGDPDTGSNFALVRYNADGSLDPSFGSSGVVITGPNTTGAAAIALQPDGKIVAVGSTFSFATAYDAAFQAVRYNADGSLDPSFGSGGIVTTDVPAAVPPELTPVVDTATSVMIEPDGKVVVGGYVAFQANNGSELGFLPTIALVRYESGGGLDPSFGVGGIDLTDLSGSFTALASQPDGKIVAAYTAYINPAAGADFGVARFLGLDLNIAGPILGLTGQRIAFAGTFDDQAGATTSGVTWTFGDGTSLTYPSAAAPGALTPAHVYKKFGVYEVTLTIHFASGGTATTSEPILVLPAWGARARAGSPGASGLTAVDDAIGVLDGEAGSNPTLLDLAQVVVATRKRAEPTGPLVL